MPRKSAAAIQAMGIVSSLTDHRPPPPDGLTQEQQDEWVAITRRLPADYFPRECHRLLEAYVRHCSVFRGLSEMVDTFEPVWMSTDEGLARFDKLLALREREGRALSSLATRLRISPQSRFQRTTAASAAASGTTSGEKPWERHR